MEEINSHVPFKLSYDMAEELIYSQVNSKGVLLALLKANCFWWSCGQALWKKAFARSVVAYRVRGSVFICSSKETTSGTMATISHYLINFMVATYQSPWSIYLLYRPNGSVKGKCGGNHNFCIFQVLDVVISVIPPELWYWFWFPLLASRGNSDGFDLAFPTIILSFYTWGN